MGSEVHQTGRDPMALPGIPVRKKRGGRKSCPDFGGFSPRDHPSDPEELGELDGFDSSLVFFGGWTRSGKAITHGNITWEYPSECHGNIMGISWELP
jgi:hypothetical protein